MGKEFDETILFVADRIQRILCFVSDEIKQDVEEIRLRAGLPVCLTVKGRVMFVHTDSQVLSFKKSNLLIATHQELKETLSLLCNSSVYLHESEIKQGYVSLPRGNRAGVCGVFNSEGMLVCISSINIRIARQVFGCARSLVSYAKNGLLIAGPAGSGKTTILRDLIRLLSNGEDGRCKRVCVIDSRGEISGGFSKKTFNDLGDNTDVLYMQNKALGTQIALRTMFPDIIAFDEIGTEQELKGVKDCFNSGVGIITTIHSKEVCDLMQRTVAKSIIKSCTVKYVALLTGVIGEKPKILSVEELCRNADD